MISSPKRGSAWSSVLIASLLLLPLAACGKNAEKDEAAPAAAVAVLRPLPETGYKVEWGKVEVPTPVAAGKTVPVKVTLKNAGDQIWPDKATGDPGQTGANAVRLAWRLLPPPGPTDGEGYSSKRVDLPQPLPPGQSVTLTAEVKAPDQPGDYEIQLDLVQELVTWFERKGAPKLIVKLKVA
jgi:acyl dehydratase